MPLIGPWLSQANASFLARYLYLFTPSSDIVNATIGALKEIEAGDNNEVKNEDEKRWLQLSELSKHMDKKAVVDDLSLAKDLLRSNPVVDSVDLLAAAI